MTKSNQEKIYKLLLQEWNRIQSRDQANALQVLSKIWDLRILPSQDPRYKTAYEDVVQHYFNNNDWSDDQLFRDRFDVFKNDEIFRNFIEAILFSENFSTNEEISRVSEQVDRILAKDSLKLVTEDFDSRGVPMQKIDVLTKSNDLPPGIKKNEIPFYVQKQVPLHVWDRDHFLLIPTITWNDYGVVSIFELIYVTKETGSTKLDYLKIIHETEYETYKKMDEKFFQLSEEFCSLSGNEEYYLTLKETFGENGMISILYALRDAAYFSDIYEDWESNSNFKHSLIRENSAERMLRDVKGILNGVDLSAQHSFSYRFLPAYSDLPVKVEFGFNAKLPLPDRIFAVIGKNGTGKTQLMNALPRSLSERKAKDFYEKIPSFSKIITVSYSVFDTFKIPKKHATFNYVYCGLKDQDGDLRSNKGLKISFHNNWKKIDDMRRLRRWRDILANVIEEEIIDQFILSSEDYDRDLEVSITGFHGIEDKLSSGQSILLYILTQVVANIRVDSLIIYDEPETHLHPNAIVELMNSIYELVNEFESYCLIATHSPLVIRELFSKNVLVMQRQDNAASLRRIGIESFGENLGVLNDEVFGDRQVPKQYKKIIEGLIDDGFSFDQILNMLQSDEVPLSLNARIYISNLIKLRNEKR